MTTPTVTTAHALHTAFVRERRCITLGCDMLDACLGGGVYTGGITELAGEAGAGKTQLALTLLLHAQLPPEDGGLGASTAFVTTEGEFPVDRLSQLLPRFARRMRATDVKAASVAALARIFVEKAMDIETLWKFVDERLPSLLEQKGVRLVVLDSIAALFRGDVDYGESTRSALGERASWMTRCALRMKALADEYDVAFVVTNQVSDVFVAESASFVAQRHAIAALSSAGAGAMLASSAAFCSAQPWVRGGDDRIDRRGDGVRRVKPALGLAWSHLIGTRVMIHRASSAILVEGSVVRHLRLVFSPRHPRSVCSFVILRDGVKGVRDDDL